MAFGKMRNKQRSSSSNSFVSTPTILVFVALCVLGAWLLTSERIISPRSTHGTFAHTRLDASTDILEPEIFAPTVQPAEKIHSGPLEGNPGDFPDDIVKDDKPEKSQQDQKLDQASTADYSESMFGASHQQAAMKEDELNGNGSETDDSDVKLKKDQSLDETGTKDYPKESNVGASEQLAAQRKDGMQGDGPENSDIDSKEGNNEPQLYTSGQGNQGLDGKEPIEKQVSEEIRASPNEDDQGSTTDESTGFDNPENNPNGKQESSKSKDHVEENKGGEQGLRNPTDHLSNEEEKQKDENQNENEGEQQKQHGETITFSDETQEGASRQDTKEDTNTKLEKDDSDQQDKQMVRQTKEKASKQVDSQQESGHTKIDKHETTTSIEHKPAELNPLLNVGIPKESNESKTTWSTQAAQSHRQKQRHEEKVGQDEESLYGYTWWLCNVTAAPDYIPCLDNEKALKKLRSTRHFEHRERHCPEDPPTCLVPLPQGYKKPVRWPESRNKIWFNNVPHTEPAKVKGHQNWVKVTGEFLTFPGGGTQFIHGALSYIEFIEKISPGIKLGKHTRVVLDVGCGVASFGGYLFEKDVLTMSFAPKDEHEAQVQFALERGIPAISAVMGSQRLPFPSGVFDVVHCARCRVPWHAEGGRLLLELNRVMRPGGCFIWSAIPVYQNRPEDVEIWKAMSSLTASMCWELEKKEKDTLNKIGVAIFRKPINNECYDRQRQQNSPPMCKPDDDPNAAWYVPLQSCLHRVPTDKSARGSKWPLRWPKRLRVPPYWLNETQKGIYGKPAPDDFVTDYKHWQRVISKSYLYGLGISWSDVRNVMDMRAVYGGFAAALRHLKVWVMNVVNVNAPDTLPIIYERGLFGIYHDWCESFSTYPRTYDLLHADHLFSKLKERCELAPVMAEVDRIVRPGGKFIVRDDSSTIEEVEILLKSLHWEVHLTFSKDQEGILGATKSDWRPKLYAIS